MGAMKDFALFCRENDIPAGPASIMHWQLGRVRSPELKIDGDRDLTFDDIERFTGGTVGTFEGGCPFCDAKTAFKVERPTLNFARWHCFYCGRSGSVSSGKPIDPAAEAEAERIAAAYDNALDAQRTERALELWEEGETVVGSPVIRYLAARRIEGLPPNVDKVLRFHSSCSFGRRHGRHPAMLALFRNVKTDEPCAVHRTWIDPSGRAVLRMALGPIGRGAIKLWPTEGDSLVVGEGIETTLAAALHLTRANGEVLRPAWAMSVANNLKFFPVLKKIRRLVILADNDESGVGQAAAEMCSQRWSDAGREVLKLMPAKVGTDFNDVVKEKAR